MIPCHHQCLYVTFCFITGANMGCFFRKCKFFLAESSKQKAECHRIISLNLKQPAQALDIQALCFLLYAFSSYNTPLVLGSCKLDGSRRTAILTALAKALKMASIL